MTTDLEGGAIRTYGIHVNYSYYILSEETAILFACINKIENNQKDYIKEMLLKDLINLFKGTVIRETKLIIRHIFIIEEGNE